MSPSTRTLAEPAFVMHKWRCPGQEPVLHLYMAVYWGFYVHEPALYLEVRITRNFLQLFSDYFATVLFALIVSVKVRNTETNQKTVKFIFLFHETNQITTETD
jgi:hypothetical protein